MVAPVTNLYKTTSTLRKLLPKVLKPPPELDKKIIVSWSLRIAGKTHFEKRQFLAINQVDGHPLFELFHLSRTFQTICYSSACSSVTDSFLQHYPAPDMVFEGMFRLRIGPVRIWIKTLFGNALSTYFNKSSKKHNQGNKLFRQTERRILY